MIGLTDSLETFGIACIAAPTNVAKATYVSLLTSFKNTTRVHRYDRSGHQADIYLVLL